MTATRRDIQGWLDTAPPTPGLASQWPRYKDLENENNT